MPQSNLDYWKPKLERNVTRDAEKDTALRGLGWRVLVVWECEIKTGDGVADIVKRLAKELDAVRKTLQPPQ